MELGELRQNIINELSSFNNNDLLEVRKFLNFQKGVKENTYLLSTQEKEEIARAREQVGKGEFLTNDEANKQIREWLKP